MVIAKPARTPTNAGERSLPVMSGAAAASSWQLGLLLAIFFGEVCKTAVAISAQATFYPYIDAGSCGYGKLDKKWMTKRFIAAVSDQVPNHRSLCGACFRVRCVPQMVTDHHGTQYGGAPKACRSLTKSTIVSVTDECTCKGNTKWCCDKKLSHLDLSWEAFNSIADLTKSGVIAIDYQRVPCPGSANRRKAKPRRCSKTVGPWEACGGLSTNVKAWQKDAPWPGVCCRSHLKCVRKSKYFHYCKRI